MIQTNKLTEQVTILEYATSATTYGGLVEYWKPCRTVYMNILNQKGNKSFYQDHYEYEDSISFYGRYLDIKKKGTRLRYKDGDYIIDNLTTVQRNKATIIDCHLIS